MLDKKYKPTVNSNWFFCKFNVKWERITKNKLYINFGGAALEEVIKKKYEEWLNSDSISAEDKEELK